MDDDARNDAEAEQPEFELERVVTLPARWPARGRRGPLTLGAGLALLAALLVLASLRGVGAAPQTRAVPSPAATAAQVSQAAPLVPTPDPATLALPPPCALEQPLDVVEYFAVPAFGGTPLWISGFDDPTQRVVHFERSPSRLLTLRGWIWRVLLVTDLRYLGSVTLTGAGPHGALLFTQGAQAAVPSLALDTRAPASIINHWGDWPTYIYLPEPGCYEVRATWPGGGWRVTFSAGR